MKIGERVSINFYKYHLKYICIASFLLFNSAFCATVVVSPESCKIQDAIDMALIGDTIEVHSGLYREHINISKPVTLHGLDDGNGMPVIASNVTECVIKINADRVTLDGLHVKAFNYFNGSGIIVTSDNSIIKNNLIENNGYSGIKILNSYNSSIVNNSIFNNDYGIILSNADSSIIDTNFIKNNYIAGIELDRSALTNITGNIISDNGIGYIYDDYSITSEMNLDNTNTFYGNDCDSQEISKLSQM